MQAVPNKTQIVAGEYHTSITRRQHEQSWRDMRVELASHEKLKSHTEQADPAELGAEKLPEYRTSITRWRHEQVAELARETCVT